jgi:glyoxylase-like metal-dependent hydrolase (beta-lactamase superfamily II)
MSNDLYEIAIVKYGTRSTVKSDVYLNFHIYDRPDDPVEMAYYFWLIRNDETTVVVDTGFSQHGAQVRSRTFLIEPLRAFQLLGVDPDTGPPVVVTHAHYDHIGNLDLFDKSRISMSRTELEFWLSPFSERRQYKHSVETDELKVLAAAHAEGRIDVFDGRHVLMPGIELIEVGGHTPGQAVVKVDTAHGAVLLASDAVHYYEEYEQDMPFMFVSDLYAMYATFDRIHAMEASGEIAHVVSGHDPATLNRFGVAGEGELAGLMATIGTPGPQERTR